MKGINFKNFEKALDRGGYHLGCVLGIHDPDKKNICKKCKYYLPQKVISRQRQWQLRNPERFKEINKVVHRKWQLENKEYRNEYQRQWRIKRNLANPYTE